MDTLRNETLLVSRIIKKPIMQHCHLIFNHFSRYDAAIQKLCINRKDSVIDASCGEGYGSFILSLRAKKVFGLDINNDYLKAAKNNFRNKNLSYHTYDEFDELCRAKRVQKAQKIACIETFEHIPRYEINYFMKRLLSYLKRDGHMFLTVPIGANNPNRCNKFHLNEPSVDFIRNMFKPLFKKMTFDIKKLKNSFDCDARYCHVLLNYFNGKYDNEV